MSQFRTQEVVEDTREISQALIEQDSTFVAVQKSDLADPNEIRFLSHLPLPIGTSGYDKLGQLLGGINDDSKCEYSLKTIYPEERHVFRRAPLYVSPMVPGLQSRTLEECIPEFKDCLSTGNGSNEAQPQEIEFDALVRKLANAGAAAVEVETSFIEKSSRFWLRVPIASEAEEIIGRYNSVMYDSNEYDLTISCTLDGPEPVEHGRLTVYLQDPSGESDGRSIEEGLRAFESFYEDNVAVTP